jgi:hypothetical protein
MLMCFEVFAMFDVNVAEDLGVCQKKEAGVHSPHPWSHKSKFGNCTNAEGGHASCWTTLDGS